MGPVPPSDWYPSRHCLPPLSSILMKSDKTGRLRLFGDFLLLCSLQVSPLAACCPHRLLDSCFPWDRFHMSVWLWAVCSVSGSTSSPVRNLTLDKEEAFLRNLGKGIHSSWGQQVWRRHKDAVTCFSEVLRVPEPSTVRVTIQSLLCWAAGDESISSVPCHIQLIRH